jgi:hypothetical protein
MRTPSTARVFLLGALTCAPLQLGCSASQTPAESGDASVDATPSAASAATTSVPGVAFTHPSIVRAHRLAASDAATRSLFEPNAGALKLGDDGASYASLGFRSQTRVDASRMGALLPVHADAEWRIGPGRVDRWSMRLQGKGMRSAAGVLDAGLLVYEEAWTHTDVIVNSGERGVEWMLHLQDAAAPTSFAWKLSLGADLQVRMGHLPDGSIELVDGSGDTAIRIHPAFALDAHGTKRAAKLAIEEGELRLSLDAAGLEYPILIDPLASIPIWQLADATYFSAIPQGGVMVRFGTTGPLEYAAGVQNGGPFLSAASTWNGSSWSAAPSFPIAAAYAAAAYTANGKSYVYGGCTQGGAACATPGITALSGSSALYVGNAATHAWSTVCANTTCGTGTGYDWDGPGLAAVGNQLIHFGGGNTGGSCNFGAMSATNVLDASSAATSFTQLSPAVHPGGRFGHVFVGGPNAPVAMLFGGGANNCVPYYSDTWLWTPTSATNGNWTCTCNCTSPYAAPCANQPPPTLYAASAWDEARQHFVVFGGVALAGDASAPTQATYDFDPVAKTWSALCTNGGVDACGINARTWPSAAYDPNLRQVIVAGSVDAATWRLSVRGGTCSTGAQCDTGNCVNGTCCSTASCPTCQSCALPGTEGVCTNIAALSPDPTHGCAACDGAGACKTALGGSCSAGSTCASGFCVNGTCCSTSSCGVGLSCATPTGTCQEVLGGACTSNGQCASGNCVDAVCCNAASCAAGSHCNFGAPPTGGCLKDNGQACTAGAQCGSGNCVDGVCCNTACGGQCQACDAGGSVGTCVTIAGAVHPNASGVSPRAACTGAGTPCGASCNGSDATACHAAPISTSCGTASCSGRTATLVGNCDGSGSCVQSTQSCGNYLCGTVACKTSCTVDGDCSSPSLYCNAGQCVPKVANGSTCGGASACTSGFCVAGLCCDSACATSGFTCSASGSVGTCRKANGTACAAAGECASGNCVDGVCCNSACGGQCQACDVSGSAGTCIAVSGPAHPNASGATPRAACGGSGTCGASCNGVDTTQCHYPGATSACGAQSCASGVQTNVGACNGSGTCTQTTTPCGAYTCGGAACKTQCTVDADCGSSSYWCSGNTCLLKQPNGNACAAANGCASGNCVSGLCCDSACTTTGFSCNLPTARGHCAKANATACAANAECGSGFCVDGVCCDSACTGQCQACDVSGTVGTCSPARGAPHAARAACTGTGAGTTCGPSCDGTDTTACHYPNGATKCGADTCTDGSSLSTFTRLGICNSAGSCTASTGDCSTYKCSGSACLLGCTVKADCQPGNYCSGGLCVPIQGLGKACTDATACPSGYCVDGVCCGSASCDVGSTCNSSPLTAGRCTKLLGQKCGADGDCGSGHCVDGYCCNSSCSNSCEACSVSGKEGTCVPVVGQPKPGHPACSASPTDPVCGLSCNGTDANACHAAPSTTSCGVASCASSTETDVTTCDGSGSCPQVKRTCGAYQCSTTQCLTACVTDADCASGNFCKSGACVGAQELGNACAGDGQCKSGHCADGVCCGVAGCGAGAACSGLGANAGQCLKGNGVACAASSECAAGHCVDGVCCDKGCDGQCEACDVKGSEGTCTPVTGVPHGVAMGTRAVCDALAATDCAKTTCDGATRDKCGGFANGTTTPCGQDDCRADKNLQKHGACDGHGACAMPDPTACVEYACDPTAKACRTSCTTDADCSSAYKCDTAAGKCIQGASCSGDKLQSIDKTGVARSCAPFLCGSDGNCLNRCGTSDDCVPGTSCDPTTQACVGVVNQTTTSSGGCDASGGSRASGDGGSAGSLPGIAGIAGLVGILARASRRRRR